MRTLGRIHADWLFVGPSAAIVHDLAIPPSAMWPLCIAKVGSGTYKGTSLTRRTRVQACEVVVLDGMRVTTIDQTVVDCMRQLPFAAALSVADSYLRTTNQTRECLEELVKPARMGQAGIRNARIVAAHADGRAESWGDSEARAAMLELGFALPELQVPYLDPITEQCYRADFSWDLADAGTVIGEMDGFSKYTDKTMSGGDKVGAFVRERQRESRLTIGGRSVIRFTPAQVASRQYFEILLESYGIPRAKPLSGWKKLRCR